MAKPNDRYVVRNPDGGWDVKAVPPDAKPLGPDGGGDIV